MISFPRSLPPEELCEALIDLLFNYSMTVNEERSETFKDDVGTIYLLYSELRKLRSIS
jgi:hypothetical protein|uniref:Uncharacterized protein n=1 Tax=Siphoviridae sp. ctZE52 TaxID=2825557 RepID=A0A8S5P3H6_9CAUD|nr:MAG TPA: hypothetical protein [Siphoviridae sp. ctZE52]